eukprot:7562652-Pyramimonas_sp.AAC.1
MQGRGPCRSGRRKTRGYSLECQCRCGWAPLVRGAIGRAPLRGMTSAAGLSVNGIPLALSRAEDGNGAGVTGQR